MTTPNKTVKRLTPKINTTVIFIKEDYPNEDYIYTLPEAAAYLRVTEKTFEKYIHEGTIRYYKYSHATFIKKKDLDYFLSWRLFDAPAIEEATQLVEFNT